MIDYYAHMAAFQQLRSQVPVAGGATPSELVRMQDFVDAAASDEGAALTGLFVDHVLTHAASDGTEIDLLERAGALWGRGIGLYEAISDVRRVVEKALTLPSAPGAAEAFNNAMARMVTVLRDAKELQPTLLQLRADLRPLKHLPPHPREADQPISSWGYGDLLLARRGDAFARALFDRADLDVPARALALGALASYAGNVTGSAYLGHGVGGPRRRHRFRDRLARNAVGVWCARQYGLPEPGELAYKLGSRVPAEGDAKPSAMAQRLAQALGETYDPARTPPLPDINLGLRRTLRQLELYDIIRRPELPAALTDALAVVIQATPAGGASQSQEPLIYPHSNGGGLGSGGTVTGADTTDQTTTNGGTCGWVGLIVFVLVFVIACIVGLVDKGSCAKGIEDLWDGLMSPNEPDQPTDVTAAGLTALAQSPMGPEVARRLFEAQLGLWQAVDQGFNYLALVGLIPPDDLLLASPLYGQFVALPEREPYPLKGDPAAEKTYAFDPSTPAEQPTERPSPYSSGDDPSVFVEGTAPERALALLLQIIRGEHDSDNLDADADRGYLHGCWTTAPDGSVHDDPVPVQVLDYTET